MRQCAYPLWGNRSLRSRFSIGLQASQNRDRNSTVSEIIGADDNTKGSREAAVLGIGRSGFAAWRWSGGYVVGREPFDPRVRNWGGNGAARSLRLPRWAEGEKRLLSAIKKPYAAIHKVAW